jgi:hypothetical protein
LPAFVKTSAVKAKIAPWWLVRRDNFPAQVPGLCPALSSGNTPTWQAGSPLKQTTGLFINARPYFCAVMVNEHFSCTLDSYKTLTITKKHCLQSETIPAHIPRLVMPDKFSMSKQYISINGDYVPLLISNDIAVLIFYHIYCIDFELKFSIKK